MERHTDHMQKIYFLPLTLKNIRWQILVWHLVDGKLRGEFVTALNVRFLRRHHDVYTHSQGVSVVVGRNKVSIPTKASFPGRRLFQPCDPSRPIDWEIILFVLCSCNVFLKTLEELWYKHTTAKFFASESVLNIKPFLYACVFVYVCWCVFVHAVCFLNSYVITEYVW